MQKQGHADAHSHAVDRRDNWRLRRRDGLDELCRGDRAGFLQEAVEVVACGETVAAAGDVDDTDLVFIVCALDCLAQDVVFLSRYRCRSLSVILTAPLVASFTIYKYVKNCGSFTDRCLPDGRRRRCG